MRLEELLKGVPLTGGTWNGDTEITGISFDTVSYTHLTLPTT